MANKKISELTSATTPLAGTEEVAIVQGGTTKKVAVSEFGGGGTSLRRDKYSVTFGAITFSSSTLYYSMRRNIQSIYDALHWETGFYNGATSAVTDARMWGFPITFNQKVTKIIFDYEAVSASTTFRFIYYKPNPSGFSNNAIDNQTIHETTLINTGGFRQPHLIEIPVDFTMESGGCISVVVFNNNVSTTVRTLGIWIETEEVI